jgi:hypothetical protein
VPNRFQDQLVRRIQGEYLEMPGLRLTREQAQRLWALDDETCVTILNALVEHRFLVRGSDGRYRRITDGNEPAHVLRMPDVDMRMPAGSSRAR